MDRIAVGLAVALAISVLLNIYGFYISPELGRAGPAGGWKTTCVELGGQVVKVYVADTPEKREESFRYKDRIDFLGANASGMLFTFENTPSVIVFDMKDINFKLRLVHVIRTALGDHIAEAIDMEPGKTYPIKTYGTKDYLIALDPGISISGSEVKLVACG